MLTGDTSELDTLMYAGNLKLPERDSYSVTMPDGVTRSSLDGGLPKLQIQFLNQPYAVGCTYKMLSEFESAFMETFFKKNRYKRFIVYLLIGSTELEPFVVQLDSVPSVTKTGFSGSVTVTYQVYPAVDREYEQFIYDFGMLYENPVEMFDIFDIAVKSWPTASN